jgi:hypothetical protein
VIAENWSGLGIDLVAADDLPGDPGLDPVTGRG